MPSGSTFSNYLLIKEKVFKQKALGALCHPAATPCAGSRQGQDAGVAEAALGRGRGEAFNSGVSAGSDCIHYSCSCSFSGASARRC